MSEYLVLCAIFVCLTALFGRPRKRKPYWSSLQRPR